MAHTGEEDTMVSTAEGMMGKEDSTHHPSTRNMDRFLEMFASRSPSISRICRAFVGNVEMLGIANRTVSRYERMTSFNECYVSCIALRESSWLRFRILSREIRDERRNRDLRILTTGRFFFFKVTVTIISR